MYDKQINHNNRTAFIIAVDCSTSMREMITFNSQYMSKADAVALVCNYMIDELMSRATRSGAMTSTFRTSKRSRHSS